MKKFSLKNFKFLFLSIVIIMSLFACKKDDDSNSAAPANASVNISRKSVDPIMQNYIVPFLNADFVIKNTGGSTLNTCTFTITVVTKANKTKDLIFSVKNLALAPNASVTKTLTSTESIPYNLISIIQGVVHIDGYNCHEILSSATLKADSIIVS